MSARTEGAIFRQVKGLKLIHQRTIMKTVIQFLAGLAALSLLVALSVCPASAQSNIGKAIVEKLTVKVAALEKACSGDIRKYCRTVTPGEGRMIYCMQAHEDKISPKCSYELGQAAA